MAFLRQAGVVKSCARCSKQVYPTEELNCLDKVWHRGCFKCTTCGTSLNLKSYKGYEKLPYCSVHYPTQKHTVVIDNPEMNRLRENTKNQSDAKYRAEFKKCKGKFTMLPNDPNTMWHIEHQKIVSQVEYKGGLGFQQASSMSRLNGGSYTNLGSPSSSPIFVEEAIDMSMKHPIPVVHEQEQNRQEQETPRFIFTTSNVITLPAINTRDCSSKTNGNTNGQNGSTDDADKAKKIPFFKSSIPSSTVSNHSCDTQDSLIHVNDANHSHTRHAETNDVSEEINECNGEYPAIATFNVRALYDYQAMEIAEISFQRGDVILDCMHINHGWMNGTHGKTRCMGVLPAGYVVKI